MLVSLVLISWIYLYMKGGHLHLHLQLHPPRKVLLMLDLLLHLQTPPVMYGILACLAIWSPLVILEIRVELAAVAVKVAVAKDKSKVLVVVHMVHRLLSVV
jgi:hypothetical protein